MACVSRKQVVKTDTPAGSMYYFPKTTFENSRSWTEREQFQQMQEREHSEFQGFSLAIGTCMQPWDSGEGYVPAVFGRKQLTCGGGPPGLERKASAMNIDLVGDQSKLQKVIGISEKMVKYVRDMKAEHGPRLNQAVKDLKSYMEAAEKTLMEVSFAAKFGKTLDSNTELDEAAKAKLHSTVEAISGKLVEEVKVVRALFCGKK